MIDDAAPPISAPQPVCYLAQRNAGGSLPRRGGQVSSVASCSAVTSRQRARSAANGSLVVAGATVLLASSVREVSLSWGFGCFDEESGQPAQSSRGLCPRALCPDHRLISSPSGIRRDAVRGGHSHPGPNPDNNRSVRTRCGSVRPCVLRRRRHDQHRGNSAGWLHTPYCHGSHPPGRHGPCVMNNSTRQCSSRQI